MNIFLIFLLFILVIIRKKLVESGVLSALYLWINIIIPNLFPVMIISEFLFNSRNMITLINKLSDKLYISNLYLYTFTVSFLCGSPTNVKILSDLQKINKISTRDFTTILSSNITFNPLFIVSVSNIKIFIIITLSNFIYGLYLSKSISNININTQETSIINSISNSMNILYRILGVIIICSIIISVTKTKFNLINIFISLILEITNAVGVVNRFNLPEIIYIFLFNFGGISLWMQIKSILTDTSIDYKLLLKNKLVIFLISIGLYSITECFVF